MQLTIQPLIDLANTDLELQTSIYSRSHLERQIDTARSVVDQHQKLFEQKRALLKNKKIGKIGNSDRCMAQY